MVVMFNIGDFARLAVVTLRMLAQMTGRVADMSELGQQIGPAFDRLVSGLGAAGVTLQSASLAWYDGDADGT